MATVSADAESTITPTPGEGGLPGEERRPPMGVQSLAAFESRPFRYLWLNTFAFNLNQGTQRFTFVWLAIELSDRSSVAGTITFMLGIPVFLFGLPAGVLGDRSDRRVLLAISQAAATALTLTVAVLIWTDTIALWSLILLAAGIGGTVALSQPVRSAIVSSVVPQERLMNGIILMTMAQNAAQILGPALGGIAIRVFDIGAAFAIQAAIYGVGMLALIPMRLPRVVPRPRNVRAELGEGLHFVVHHRAVRVLVGIVLVSSFLVIGPFSALVPKLAKDELGADAFAVSMLYAGQGVLSLIGSIVMASHPNMRGKGRLFLFGLIAGGLILTGIGLSPWYALTAILMGSFGITGALYINLNQALIQANTPQALMGRVMSLHTLGLMGLGPMGALVAGPVADIISPQATIAIAGLTTAVLTIGVLLFEPILQRMD